MAKQHIIQFIDNNKKIDNHLPCTASCVALSPEVLGLDSKCPNRQKKIIKLRKN